MWQIFLKYPNFTGTLLCLWQEFSAVWWQQSLSLFLMVLFCIKSVYVCCEYNIWIPWRLCLKAVCKCEASHFLIVQILNKIKSCKSKSFCYTVHPFTNSKLLSVVYMITNFQICTCICKHLLKAHVITILKEHYTFHKEYCNSYFGIYQIIIV